MTFSHLVRQFWVMIAGGLLLFTACDNSGTNDPSDESGDFDRIAMLDHLGNNIILPAYRALQGATDALDGAVTQFSTDPSMDNLNALRSALKSTRLVWQDASMFQFGPAETVALRGVLNTYPTDSDQIAANINSGTYVLGTIDNIDAGGFAALGYLLYGNGLSDEEVLSSFSSASDATGRMQYLQDNTALIKTAVDFVADEWEVSGGNYIATFLSEAKAGADVGSSLGELANAMVLHLERFTRDGKIGIPAGVRSAGVPRPLAAEAVHGGYSVELAAANLAALARLFAGEMASGTDGVSIEENLAFLDAGDLATDISQSFSQNLSSLNALSDPLEQQIETDLDAVLSVFTSMQDLVVLLKVDMTSRLGITITFQDNDGD